MLPSFAVNLPELATGTGPVDRGMVPEYVKAQSPLVLENEQLLPAAWETEVKLSINSASNEALANLEFIEKLVFFI
jgi:hypothetical protein